MNYKDALSYALADVVKLRADNAEAERRGRIAMREEAEREFNRLWDERAAEEPSATADFGNGILAGMTELFNAIRALPADPPIITPPHPWYGPCDAAKSLSEAIQTYYRNPPHGWTCYHCGETFKVPGLAAEHFGADLLDEPACQIKAGHERNLVAALRDAEARLARYTAEDSDKDREFHAIRADHAVALRREEEAGYEKGLRDGQQLDRDFAAILDRAYTALRSTYPRLALPSDVRDTVSAAIYTIEAFAAERGIKLGEK